MAEIVGRSISPPGGGFESKAHASPPQYYLLIPHVNQSNFQRSLLLGARRSSPFNLVFV